MNGGLEGSNGETMQNVAVKSVCMCTEHSKTQNPIVQILLCAFPNVMYFYNCCILVRTLTVHSCGKKTANVAPYTQIECTKHFP